MTCQNYGLGASTRAVIRLLQPAINQDLRLVHNHA
jgi:hypothetical protein